MGFASLSMNRQYCLWSYEWSKKESLSREIQICINPTSGVQGKFPDGMERPQISRAMSGALRPLDRAEIFRRFAPGISGLEFCRELLGLPGEDADVGADRDEEAAAFEPAPGIGFDAGEDSRRLARFSDAADRVVDDRHDFRIVGLAGIAERGVQVGRPDKDAVHAFHRGDLLQIVEPLLVLDLNQKADLLVRALGVVLHA